MRAIVVRSVAGARKTKPACQREAGRCCCCCFGLLAFLVVLGVADASAAAASAPPVLERAVTIDDSRIVVRFSAADFAASLDDLTDWVGRRARIVRDFYGRFPVKSVRLVIREGGEAGVHGGREYSADFPLINISIGRDTMSPQLEDDWVLVHELIHLAFPEIGYEHAWLAEGLAVYVEGVARTQAGNETPAEFWGGLVDDMPKGEPRAGDKGLDRTHTWGRTYWGGALFCLQADVMIRERTGNRKGLQDALREVLRVAGGNTNEWPIEKVLAIADGATGTDVLTTLYREHSQNAEPIDLDAIWHKLGIARHDGRLVFDDSAPLAAVRIAITRRSSP